jgi:hypothetical protein
MLDIGFLRLGRRSVYRTLNLPQRAGKSLGPTSIVLNRVLAAPDKRIARHKTRQEPAAMRDFDLAYDRYGSRLGHSAMSLSVRFARKRTWLGDLS